MCTDQALYELAQIESGRVLICASNLQLNILSKSKRVGSDGTFASAPNE